MSELLLLIHISFPLTLDFFFSYVIVSSWQYLNFVHAAAHWSWGHWEGAREGRGASQAAWGTSARAQGVRVGYGVQIPKYGNMGLCITYYITYLRLYVWDAAPCGPTSESSGQLQCILWLLLFSRLVSWGLISTERNCRCGVNTKICKMA